MLTKHKSLLRIGEYLVTTDVLTETVKFVNSKVAVEKLQLCKSKTSPAWLGLVFIWRGIYMRRTLW